MTERERDKRDLAILSDLDAGYYPPDVAKKYNVSRWHIMALLEDALQ